MVNGRLNLIFDADDTLWDSNPHFLAAEEAFANAMLGAAIGCTQARLKETIHRREIEVIRRLGYGRGPFVAALHETVDELAPGSAGKPLHARVEAIGRHLAGRPCPLLPGVEATLAELSRRHRLMLLTKGQPDEQLAKLEASGLRPRFSRVDVVAEKDTEVYRRLIAQELLECRRSFMIGNSPRSDINPALRAGLCAVYIPYAKTWQLEHEELDLGHERLIVVEDFSQLRTIF